MVVRTDGASAEQDGDEGKRVGSHGTNGAQAICQVLARQTGEKTPVSGHGSVFNGETDSFDIVPALDAKIAGQMMRRRPSALQR